MSQRIHVTIDPEAYRIEDIERPYQTLQALNLFGGLEPRQVANLLFLNRPNPEGKIRTASTAYRDTNRYCLQRLKKIGLVKVKPIGIPKKAPAYWGMTYLTETGYKVLSEHLESLGQTPPPYRRPAQSVTPAKINYHSMGIRDAVVSALVGAWRNHLELVQYLDGDQIRSLSKQGKIHWPMEPDFVLIFRYGDMYRVFLGEVDRGTESGRSLASNSIESKMDKYRMFLASQRKDDPWLGRYPPPDVMILTEKERRLPNLIKITGERGGRSAYWFTTMELVSPPYTFFDAVWQRIALPGYYSPTERFVSEQAS